MKSGSKLSVFIIWPVLSGFLFWLAWPPHTLPITVFVAFIPLLIAEKQITTHFKKRIAWKVWLSLFTGLMLWNLFTTWWVSNASIFGGVFANILNAVLMTIPFMLSRRIRKQFGNRIGYISLVFFWMSFEYIHLRWDFTWPWLSLGNVFAARHTWIQWYEYTGVFGGTLWAWTANLIIFYIIYDYFFPGEKDIANHPSTSKKFLPHFILILVIAIPLLISQNIYSKYIENGKPVNITVLQPNYLAESEKFTVPYDVQMEKMISWSRKKLTDSTDYLVWPETSIQRDMWVDRLPTEKPVRDIKREIFNDHPGLTMILGINGFEEYRNNDSITVTARQIIQKITGDTLYFDIYNTAIQIDSSRNVPFYHKSKLVPGVERMPYPEALAFLNKWSLDLGGISGSLGIQDERTVFFNRDSIGVAPVICYESVFGEYVTEYINKGANLIFIVTNDDWWDDTDGYRQHCMYAKLRSIENRRSIARSANTGISCFIDQRGDIYQATGYRKDAVINMSILAGNKITFYTKHGDYIGFAAIWIAIIILIASLFISIKKRMVRS